MTTSSPDLPDEQWITTTLSRLIRVRSVNPRVSDGGTYDGDGLGESQVAGVVAQLLDEIPGVNVRTVMWDCRRTNVYGTLDVGASRTLLLETHLDTVEPADHPHPFDPVVQDGVMWGRGACDAKGQIVAQLAALRLLAAQRERLHVNVQVAAVADEEHLYAGVRHLVPELDPERDVAAIIGEPTCLRMVIAHKGVVRGPLVCHGRAAHTSRPQEGDNAAVTAADLISWLEERARHLPEHPLVGPATLTVTSVHGGEGPNIVPSRCTVTVDRRTLPGEDPHRVWAELSAEISRRFGDRVTVGDPSVTDLSLAPVGGGRLAGCLSATLHSHGLQDEGIGVSYGSDASKIADVGIESVVFGPGDIAHAHGPEERVVLEDVRTAAQVIARTALELG